MDKETTPKIRTYEAYMGMGRGFCEYPRCTKNAMMGINCCAKHFKEMKEAAKDKENTKKGQCSKE